MKKQVIISLKVLLAMTVITGIIYPLLMTGAAQLFFTKKANGSLVMENGIIAGSSLIGQQFDSTIYFWSRPSAIDYNPIPSSGSNLGPANEKLKMQVLERRTAFARLNAITDLNDIPAEMLFASGSGLDPHISPEGAAVQFNRVVTSRNFNEAQKLKLQEIIEHIKLTPQFSLFGEPRINVFELNLALDNIN